MANNVNNGITGVIDIPGALRSRGAADGNLVGGVVAYAGDIYDVTAGKNQATLNAEFAEGITNASSSSFSGNYNDLSNIPLLKTAENGFKVNAHGRRKNTASEQDSFAEGAGTTASGLGSHSEGGGTIASGTCSHAEGNGVSAVGNSSHAEGSFTAAIGSNSHAEGNNAHAYGSNTHAEGWQETLLPLTTRAYTATSGTLYIDTEIFPGCIIYDTDDTPRRVYSCEYQEIGNDYEVAFQGINEDLEIGDEIYVDFCAYGENSHTEGYDTHTYGASSHAEGVHTITTNEAEHASGMYNMSTANKTLFSVGAGHDGSRMNAFEIDTSSNVYIYGVGGYNGTNSTTTGIKSLQGVISDIESNSSSSSSSYTHPSTHPASMITYSSSETYSSGNVGYEIKQIETDVTDVNTRLSDLEGIVLTGDNIVIATSPYSGFYSTDKGAEDNIILGSARVEYTLLASEGSFKRNIIVGKSNNLNNCDRTAISDSIIFGNYNDVTGGVCIGAHNTNQSTSDARHPFTLLGTRLKAGDSTNITYNYNFIPNATVIGVNNNPTTFNGIYSIYKNNDWTDGGAFEVGAGKNNTSVSILAQKSDGSLYIKGVGGWDGMSPVKNTKSINTIISEFETRIAALESQIAALTNNL